MEPLEREEVTSRSRLKAMHIIRYSSLSRFF